MRLVDRFAVAAEQLEELAVHVHRVQAVRFVDETQLAELARPENLRGTVVPGVRGVVIEGFVVDGPLDTEGTTRAGVQPVLGTDRSRRGTAPFGNVGARG